MGAPEITSVAALMIAVATFAWGVIRGRPEIAGVASETAIALSKRMGELEGALDDERTARRMVEVQLADLQNTVREYRRGTLVLVTQLTERGIEPAWHPPAG